MNHLKKALIVTFMLAVIISVFMMTEMTSSATTYFGGCGDDLTWELDTSTGVLTIYGKGNMYNYYEYYNGSYYFTAPWHSYVSYIKSVIIKDSVTRIGTGAFYGCYLLKNVTIPDSVTSIGSYAFYYCPQITSVYISDVAVWCGIIFGDYYANPLWYGSNLYVNAEKLTELVIPDSVTSIGDYAFYGTSSLTSVTIPEPVTRIGDYAFYSCSKLTSVTIGDSVTSIDSYAFYGCDSLTSVTISDSVTRIGYHAFYDCDSLTSVHIKDIAAWCGINFGGSAANPLYYAKNLYVNGELLTEIVIPDSVTSIGICAFFGYSSLTSVTIPDSVTSIGNLAFYGTSSLTSVTIPDSVTSIGDCAFQSCDSLISVTIGNSVASIGESAFHYCTSLTSVTIGDSVTSIGNHAFYDCDSLSSVHIKDIAAWCGINFGNSFANPLYYAKNLYVNGELLTELVIPDTVTTINPYAFYDCDSLTSVTIPDSVTRIGPYAFYTCRSLTSVTIGDSVTRIGAYAFYICSKLTSVNIGDSVTSVDSYAFYDCENLCIKCHEESYGYIVALSHGHNWEIYGFTKYAYNNDATCTEDGTMTGLCECGSCDRTETVTAEGTKLDHIYTSYIYNNDATCIEDGTRTSFCYYDCGRTKTMTAENTALGHSFTNYVSDNNASCTADGTKTAKCDRCEETDTFVLPETKLGHSYGDWYTVTEPTYDTVGTEEKKCSVCSTTERRVISVLEYTNPFSDVKASNWFASSVEYCVKKGYVKGMTETTFVPNGKLTRAQFLTMLASLDGVDLTKYDNTNSGFADVKVSHWYNEVVCWAVTEGITSGLSETKFGPGNNVTRAQVARFFYVYSEKNGIPVNGRGDISVYPDATKVQSWAKVPIEWAVDAGLISGVNKNGINYLDPNGTATRAQASVMFKGFDDFRK